MVTHVAVYRGSDVKTAFAYFGGKSRMAPRIAALVGRPDVYIEPFFGSGAVLMAKAPSRVEIVNDVDQDLVRFWRVLRDRRDELEELCVLTPHARHEFVAASDLDGADDLEAARRVWVRLTQSFGKTLDARTGWSITSARNQSVPQSVFSRIGRFGPVAGRLANVSIENCDAAGLVERMATPKTVVYADPPYVHETRSSTTGYGHEMTDADHERLLDVLNNTPARVVLSGYRSALYDHALSGWWRTDIDVTMHASNGALGPRPKRTECLWLNFEPPSQMALDLAGAAV